MGKETADQGRGSNSTEIDDPLEAARRGSGEAFGQLMEACRQYLLLVANREVPPELRGKIGASDLVQETFVEAQEGFLLFQGSTETELLGWLRKILINNLRDASRRYQETGKRCLDREVSLSWTSDRMVPLQDRHATSKPSPSRSAIQRENRGLVEQALTSLSDEQRQVIEFRNFQLRSFPEIGEKMKRSSDAARKLWVRAMENLASRLARHFPDSLD